MPFRTFLIVLPLTTFFFVVNGFTYIINKYRNTHICMMYVCCIGMYVYAKIKHLFISTGTNCGTKNFHQIEH